MERLAAIDPADLTEASSDRSAKGRPAGRQANPLPPATRRTGSKAQSFRRWLRQHRRMAAKFPLPTLLHRYGRSISLSSAYRAAVAEGMRGARRNDTRYETFWSLINWELPDTMLQRIWGVWRGNLRHRRLRMNLAAARFNLRYDKIDPQFHQAVAREKRRAANYDGPRPH